MGYYRRRPRPSQYRFLFELKPTLLAFVGALGLAKFFDVVCSLSLLSHAQQTCRDQLPSYLWWGFVAMAIYGVGACAYRYYRDFYLGEYWTDLMD